MAPKKKQRFVGHGQKDIRNYVVHLDEGLEHMSSESQGDGRKPAILKNKQVLVY